MVIGSIGKRLAALNFSFRLSRIWSRLLFFSFFLGIGWVLARLAGKLDALSIHISKSNWLEGLNLLVSHSVAPQVVFHVAEFMSRDVGKMPPLLVPIVVLALNLAQGRYAGQLVDVFLDGIWLKLWIAVVALAVSFDASRSRPMVNYVYGNVISAVLHVALIIISLIYALKLLDLLKPKNMIRLIERPIRRRRIGEFQLNEHIITLSHVVDYAILQRDLDGATEGFQQLTKALERMSSGNGARRPVAATAISRSDPEEAFNVAIVRHLDNLGRLVGAMVAAGEIEGARTLIEYLIKSACSTAPQGNRASATVERVISASAHSLDSFAVVRALVFASLPQYEVASKVLVAWLRALMAASLRLADDRSMDALLWSIVRLAMEMDEEIQQATVQMLVEYAAAMPFLTHKSDLRALIRILTFVPKPAVVETCFTSIHKKLQSSESENDPFASDEQEELPTKYELNYLAIEPRSVEYYFYRLYCLWRAYSLFEKEYGRVEGDLPSGAIDIPHEVIQLIGRDIETRKTFWAELFFQEDIMQFISQALVQ